MAYLRMYSVYTQTKLWTYNPGFFFTLNISSAPRLHKKLRHERRSNTGNIRHFHNMCPKRKSTSVPQMNTSSCGRGFGINLPEMSTNQCKFSKVLVLGSGGFIIGQGGEFNYICSQSIKALKHEGIEVVLVNPNVATIHSKPGIADKVYFVAVNPENVEGVIAKERPDGIVFTFGGATAELCGLELHRRGILSKYNVKTIGTDIDTIRILSNRDSITKAFRNINVPCPWSHNVESVENALNVMKHAKYPVFIKFPYGTKLRGGPSIVETEDDLVKETSKVLASCPYAIIEESLVGWKEYQYQVLRDFNDRCIVVSNLENVNPVGINTGDSIVVAPAQTLKDSISKSMIEYSLLLTKHFKIIGLCDMKFALNPATDKFVITDLKPAPSRSSVLSSKANGCSTAYIATKLALGALLSNFVNNIMENDCSVSRTSNVVVKIPRWDFSKFEGVSQKLTSRMKSVGEVMAVGSCFEEALQKAIRITETPFHGLEVTKFDDIDESLLNPTNLFIFAIFTAMVKYNYSIEKIRTLTHIDSWFLEKIKNIADVAIELGKNKWLEVSKSEIDQPYRKHFLYSGEGYFQPPVSATPFKLPLDLLKRAKILGFSDVQIANITNSTEHLVRSIRLSNNIVPIFKTLSNTFSNLLAAENYIYATFSESGEGSIPFTDEGCIIVLGAGAYRIGSSIESDWCVVSCLKALRKNRNKTILINCNPGTLSTDSDVCDFLFFEESTFERVMDIYEFTKAKGCILSFGGQVPQIIALGLLNAGVIILGTSPVNIDRAEDRNKFSKLLDKINVSQPPWKKFTTIKDAAAFANSVSYPVVIRPSYILSGSKVSIVHNEDELKQRMTLVTSLSNRYPVVISKFMTGWREFDVDAIAYKGELLCFAVCQHLEHAGVHSGDATLIVPPYTGENHVSIKTAPVWLFKREYFADVNAITQKIAKELDIKGVFNMQMILKEASDKSPHIIKVLECNIKSSRSLPLVSKTYNRDFIELSTLSVLDYEEKVREAAKMMGKLDKNFYCVRVPVFSWKSLKGANPIMGPEMKSTGEVACFSKNVENAFLMALSAKYNYDFQNFPPSGGEPVIVIVPKESLNQNNLSIITKLASLGYKIISGTPETSEALKLLDIHNFTFIEDMLDKLRCKSSDNKSLESEFRDVGLMKKLYLKEHISMVISLVDSPSTLKCPVHRALIRSVVDCGVVYIYDSIQAALLVKAIEMRRSEKSNSKELLSWTEWQNLSDG